MDLPANAALILIDIQQGLDDPVYGKRCNLHAEENASLLLWAWRWTNRPIFHVQHSSTRPDSPLRPGQSGWDFKPDVARMKASRCCQTSQQCVCRHRFGSAIAWSWCGNCRVCRADNQSLCLDNGAYGVGYWISADNRVRCNSGSRKRIERRDVFGRNRPQHLTRQSQR